MYVCIYIYHYWCAYSQCSESEYAAWTLVNGYALNHLTVSVHRLSSNMCKVSGLNQLLQKSGIKLNSEGGILKGLLSNYIWQNISLETNRH